VLAKVHVKLAFVLTTRAALQSSYPSATDFSSSRSHQDAHVSGNPWAAELQKQFSLHVKMFKWASHVGSGTGRRPNITPICDVVSLHINTSPITWPCSARVGGVAGLGGSTGK
jgi:hypothetical protein